MILPHRLLKPESSSPPRDEVQSPDFDFVWFYDQLLPDEYRPRQFKQDGKYWTEKIQAIFLDAIDIKYEDLKEGKWVLEFYI